MSRAIVAAPGQSEGGCGGEDLVDDGHLPGDRHVEVVWVDPVSGPTTSSRRE